MTNGEKVSMEHKHYSRGRASRLRSRSLVRHATLLVGEKELRDEIKNESVEDWVGSGMSPRVISWLSWQRGGLGFERKGTDTRRTKKY